MTHRFDGVVHFTRQPRIILFLCCLMLISTQISAQTFRFRDGTTAQCTTPAGKIVQQIYLPAGSGMFMNMGFTGTTVTLPDGSARITWDTTKLNSLPDDAHDFIYYHECAHAHVPTSDELMANCVGLIDMRAAGRTSAAVEERLRQFHVGLGFMGPRYGFGPEYWARTIQCADRGGSQVRITATAATTTTCSFTSGPKNGQIIDFGNRPGVVPAMVGAQCTDGAGSFGMAVPSSASATSSAIQGDWQGTLQNWNLPIVLHLGAGGVGTADSPRQNAFGMPLQHSLNGDRINISIPSVAATYSATLRGSRISGTFAQRGQNVPLRLSKVEVTTSAPSNGIQGDWRGTLQQWNLLVVLHLNAGGVGTADSPRQNAFGMPLQYTVTGNRLHLAIPSVGAIYYATVNGSQISGTFAQNGQNLPLMVTKQ